MEKKELSGWYGTGIRNKQLLMGSVLALIFGVAKKIKTNERHNYQE